MLFYLQLLESTERRAFILELAANEQYMSEVENLNNQAHEILLKLTSILANPRRTCPRLHLLTDPELARLMAAPSPDKIQEVIHKVKRILYNHTHKNQINIFS